MLCLSCNTTILDVHINQKYCKPCSVIRRIELLKKSSTKWRKAFGKQYYQDNKIRLRKMVRDNYKKVVLNDIDKVRLYDRERFKKRWRNPSYRISRSISCQIRTSLKGKEKAGRSWEILVDYSLEELKQHLEKQFMRYMNWDNYGSYWHIDHRIPISYFSFKSYIDKSFKDCWALDNLKPMKGIDNVKKGNNYSEPTLNQCLQES